MNIFQKLNFLSIKKLIYQFKAAYTSSGLWQGIWRILKPASASDVSSEFCFVCSLSRQIFLFALWRLVLELLVLVIAFPLLASEKSTFQESNPRCLAEFFTANYS